MFAGGGAGALCLPRNEPPTHGLAASSDFDIFPRAERPASVPLLISFGFETGALGSITISDAEKAPPFRDRGCLSVPSTRSADFPSGFRKSSTGSGRACGVPVRFPREASERACSCRTADSVVEVEEQRGLARLAYSERVAATKKARPVAGCRTRVGSGWSGTPPLTPSTRGMRVIVIANAGGNAFRTPLTQTRYVRSWTFGHPCVLGFNRVPADSREMRDGTIHA